MLCLYDLINAAPEIVAKSQMHLLEPLTYSLKDVSEVTRIHVAQIYGILLAYGLSDEEFDEKVYTNYKVFINNMFKYFNCFSASNPEFINS